MPDPRQAETPLADAVDAFLADPRHHAVHDARPQARARARRPAARAATCRCRPVPTTSTSRRDLLGQAERLAAELWGADLCRFCVNGSTQGNQALRARRRHGPAIASSCRGTSTSRCSPASCWPGSSPVWVRPDVDPETGLALGVPSRADRGGAARAHRRAGGPPRRAELRRRHERRRARSPRLAHGAGAAVLVDQAWGAYLGFHPALPAHTLAPRRRRDGHLGAQDADRLHAERLPVRPRPAARPRPRRESIRRAQHDERLRSDPGEPRPDPRAAGRARRGTARSHDRARRQGAGAARERIDGLQRARAELEPRDASVRATTRRSSSLALPGTGADGLAVEADLWPEGVRVELANRDTLIPLVTIGDTEESVERLCGALERSLERRRGSPRPAGGAASIWASSPRSP